MLYFNILYPIYILGCLFASFAIVNSEAVTGKKMNFLKIIFWVFLSWISVIRWFKFHSKLEVE